MPVGTSNRKPEPQLGGGGKLPWQGYTWDPRWITENESLWSILHKFASVNVMTAKDVQQIFKYDDDQRLIHSWTDRNRDLRTAGALDLEKIGRLLALPKRVLAAATLLETCFQAHITSYASSRLRLCWLCLHNGYHSVLFQVLGLEHCPLHLTPLMNTCPLCGSTTPLFDISDASLTVPYGCPHCRGIWAKPHYDLASRVAHPKESRVFDSMREWIRHHGADQVVTVDLPRLRKFPITHEAAQSSTVTFLHRWKDVVVINPPAETFRVNRSLHIAINHPNVDPHDQGQAHDFSKPLAQVYRYVRRNLVRHVVRRHRTCIRNLATSLWMSVRRRKFDLVEVCADAYALILWRLFWEQVDRPQELLQGGIRLRLKKFVLPPGWIPLEEAPLIAAMHVMALQCLATYRHCVRVADQLVPERVVEFPSDDVVNALQADWIITVSRSKDVRIHWWWHKDWEALVIQPSHGKRKGFSHDAACHVRSVRTRSAVT